MKRLISFLFLFSSLTVRGQIVGTEFDDFCRGCCGYHLSFYSQERYSYTSGGVARFNGLGYWKFKGDTIILYGDKKDDEITAKYILSDSLTLKEIIKKEGYSLPLHKISSSYGNTKYEYNDENKLISIKIMHKGVLTTLRQFNIDGTITERNFNMIGIMQSQGTWKNGERIGEWKYYDGEGILVEKKNISK